MRIKWIDTAKGISIICVIIGHINGGVFGNIDLGFVYAFHLAVFFALLFMEKSLDNKCLVAV